MSNKMKKWEHNGAKHGKGAWETKKDAKRMSKKQRRQNAKRVVRDI